MRLHRLEVEGFGPFRARQAVDFDAFADDGIFLIGGRTGAGKSSILDAVCFALYGGVPRYDGGEKRLRSDHCEPGDVTEVVVEFSTASGRYRVTRSPEYERPAKRGGGMTTEQPSALLEEWRDDDWIGLAAKPGEVGKELHGILQLTMQQFLQVILLAQGRFAEFLLAGSKERQDLLRRLFGTERFEDYQRRLDERRRASGEALDGIIATVTARVDEAERLVADAAALQPEPGGADEGAESSADGAADDGAAAPVAPEPATLAQRLERLDAARVLLTERAGALAEARTQAQQRHTDAAAALAQERERQQAQRERDRARAALADLDARVAEIADARRTVERAHAAEALRRVLSTAERAEQDATAARTAAAQSLDAWRTHGVDLPDETAAALRAWAAERTEESGAWRPAALLEEQAAVRVHRIETAAEAVAEIERAIAETEVERTELPARIADAGARRDDARRRADRAADLAEARDRARARVAAADEAVVLEERLHDEERLLAEATAAHARAQTALADLRRRRFEGYAGELAAALEEGQSCPVCGALEHPHPAEHADPVSQDDVDAAESARDAAAQAERGAAEKPVATRASVAAAREKAGGSAEAAQEALTAAEEALAEAKAAERIQTEAEGEIADLTARHEALETRRAADQQRLAEAREEHAAARQQEQDAAAQVAAARGDHESVAARIDQATVRIRAAESAAAALEEQTTRDARAAEAVSERDGALAESDFADAAAVEAALMPADERAETERRIRDHAVQSEKERSILEGLAERDLPDEPIDLAAPEQEAAAAQESWTSAVDAASAAELAAQRLDGVVASAAEAHARSATQAEAHEALRDLADAVAGRAGNTHRMALETFVLAAELEDIVASANARLREMSSGRYELQHSDARAARGAASGLGIVVFDAFTGRTRPAPSLSGGETFLASLALALGLAEVVTARAGGIRLDTLFIDEGFGSLDPDTLEVAMRTLDELRQGGRTVGVISHVEAMQEQIPAQITVRTTAEGPSVIG